MKMRDVLGIDIGGRSLKMKGYDSDGRSFVENITINNLNKEDLLKELKGFIARHGNFGTIGISQAGVVQEGELLNCARHPSLNGISGKWFVEKGLCNSAIMINDAEAVAVYGHVVTSSDNLVALIIGTGLGCGAWKNGIVPNAGGLSDINNVMVQGLALGKRCASIAIHTDEEKAWVLNNLSHPKVRQKIEKAAVYFSTAIQIADVELRPETIFVSGGVSRFPHYFEIAMQLAGANAKVILCENPDFAGCDGAAAYATY